MNKQETAPQHDLAELVGLMRTQGEMLKAQANLIATLQKRIEGVEMPVKKEYHYQKLLEARLGAGHLHISGVGTTDITTTDAHIEIKNWRDFDNVPGQLAKYQNAVFRPQSMVYFFGKRPKQQKLHDIFTLMTAHGIEMYSFDDRTDEVIHHQHDSSDLDVTRGSVSAIKHFIRTEMVQSLSEYVSWAEVAAAHRTWSGTKLKRQLMWDEFLRCGLLVKAKTKIKVDGVRKTFTGVIGWKLRPVPPLNTDLRSR